MGVCLPPFFAVGRAGGQYVLTFGFPPPCKAYSSPSKSSGQAQAHHKLSDVPGYADKLVGEDRDVLKLRPGITGPATLKYRAEDEMLEAFVHRVRNGLSSLNGSKGAPSNSLNLSNLSNLPEGYEEMTDQELAVWYNDNVIYPDKVRLNCYYYRP